MPSISIYRFHKKFIFWALINWSLIPCTVKSLISTFNQERESAFHGDSKTSTIGYQTDDSTKKESHQSTQMIQTTITKQIMNVCSIVLDLALWGKKPMING